jgi:hypothetical protein
VVHDTKSGEVRADSAGLIDRAACSLAAISPGAGAKGYAAVLSGGPGQLWVIGDSTLAELNPVTGHTRRTVRLGELPGDGGGTWPVHVASLQPVPGKKALYAKAGGRFWRVDTRTLAATDLGLTGFDLVHHVARWRSCAQPGGAAASLDPMTAATFRNPGHRD